MKIGEGQERFVFEQIESLIESSSQAFHNNIHQYIDAYYAPILEKAEKIAREKKANFLFGDASQEANNIQRKKKAALDKIKNNNNVENLTHSLIQSLSKPQEMLILLSSLQEPHRVFVLEEPQ